MPNRNAPCRKSSPAERATFVETVPGERRRCDAAQPAMAPAVAHDRPARAAHLQLDRLRACRPSPLSYRDCDRRVLPVTGLEPDAHPVGGGGSRADRDEVMCDASRGRLVELRVDPARRLDRDRRQPSALTALPPPSTAPAAHRDEDADVDRDRGDAGEDEPRPREPMRSGSNCTSGRAAQTIASELSTRDLRRVLRAHRGDQEHGEEPDAHCVHEARAAAGRRRLRVGDHEEEEDEDLGEVTSTTRDGRP